MKLVFRFASYICISDILNINTSKCGGKMLRFVLNGIGFAYSIDRTHNCLINCNVNVTKF